MLASKGTVVNDIHSKLNATRVKRIYYPRSINDLRRIISVARDQGAAVSIAGGRHAMGGQQFGQGTFMVDTSRMRRVLKFDPRRGTVTAQAGIQWPELVRYLLACQREKKKQWGIVQKQTGTATLSLGGTMSANAHGRRLTAKPFIDEVESFVLIDAHGKVIRCSRRDNRELFRLVIGGYGVFGIVAEVTLRLCQRVQVHRVVEIVRLKDLLARFNRLIQDRVLFADYQYCIDRHSDDFLREGILPYYRPVPMQTKLTARPIKLSMRQWRELYYLAHVDGRKAYQIYCNFYLATSSQSYWSDVSDVTDYIEHYHEKVDQQLGLRHRSSEMITEVYVTRDRLVTFMEDVRRDFLRYKVPLIYGVIRLIRRDGESFLAWAKRDYACIVFNLHVEHTEQGRQAAQANFPRIIDRAIQYRGSFYLTYHRWATRKQIERCYPRFVTFLNLKRKYDPSELFQSEWYRHYREMFAGSLSSQ